MWREILTDVIEETLTGFGERIQAFGPNLLAMLLILAVGLVVAFGVRVVLRLALPRLGFDVFAQRIGLAVVLEKSGLGLTPSEAVARIVAWGTLGAFLLLAIGALDLTVAMDLISRTFSYLPQVLIALGILVLGGIVAGFVHRSVLIAAVNAELGAARFLAGAAQAALMVLFGAMALEHLGLGRQVILIAFSILFGGVVLALALAFGLAGRDLAKDVLTKAIERRGDQPIDLQRQL